MKRIARTLAIFLVALMVGALGIAGGLVLRAADGAPSPSDVLSHCCDDCPDDAPDHECPSDCPDCAGHHGGRLAMDAPHRLGRPSPPPEPARPAVLRPPYQATNVREPFRSSVYRPPRPSTWRA